MILFSISDRRSTGFPEEPLTHLCGGGVFRFGRDHGVVDTRIIGRPVPIVIDRLHLIGVEGHIGNRADVFRLVHIFETIKPTLLEATDQFIHILIVREKATSCGDRASIVCAATA